MSNLGLELYLNEMGIRFLRTQVGDRFVAEEMIKQGTILGGEQSGHIILFDTTTTGDGIVTTLKLLQIMQEEQKPLSYLCKELRKFPQQLINVKVSSKVPFENIPSLKRLLRKIKNSLGKSGRVLLRYSGTEPIARIMVEGDDKKLVHSCAAELADLIKKTLG
jgi:phosphoglucosamine mutase